MTLHDFAERHRLRVRRHEDGEVIILGKRGHLYEHGDGTLGLMFMPGKPGSSRSWNNARRKLEAACFVIWQDGDDEGSALFDPENSEQARLAIRLAGVKRRRVGRPLTLEKARELSLIARRERVQRPQAAQEWLSQVGKPTGLPVVREALSSSSLADHTG